MTNRNTIKTSKGLQKLTVSELLKKEVLTQGDIEHLTDKEVYNLKNELGSLISTTKGTERDALVKRMSGIVCSDTRNSIYEYNHRVILGKLHNSMVETGTIPSVIELSELSGLSRQTVNKHMKEYKTSNIYKEDQYKFEMLAGSVLAVVFKMAMRQDLKACKLFLEYTKQTTPSKVGTYIDKQQNNFNTILNPNVIESLTPQQIIDIEAVITDG